MAIRDRLDELEHRFQSLRLNQQYFAYEVYRRREYLGTISLVDDCAMLSECIYVEFMGEDKAKYSIVPMYEELFYKRPRQCFCRVAPLVKWADEAYEKLKDSLD